MSAYPYRIQILQKNFKNLCDAYLITNRTNIFYLTGIDFENAWILLVKNKTQGYLFTDKRFIAESKKQRLLIPYFCSINERYQNINSILNVQKKTTLGLEDTISLNFFCELQKYFKNKTTLVTCHRLIENQRMIKDNYEISQIKKATKITLKTHLYAKQIIDKIVNSDLKINEKQFAGLLSAFMLHEGADDIAFKSIVAFGKNSSNPHAIAENTLIQKGQVLLIDIGASVNGYKSDLTRTHFIGKINPLYNIRLSLIKNALAVALKKIKVGTRAFVIDREVRKFFDRYGYEKYFLHSTGHGIGLEVHEKPALNSKESSILRENMVLAIEPGIYFKKWGGMRIEELVLIKKRGAVVLSKSL